MKYFLYRPTTGEVVAYSDSEFDNPNDVLERTSFDLSSDQLTQLAAGYKMTIVDSALVFSETDTMVLDAANEAAATENLGLVTAAETVSDLKVILTNLINKVYNQ